MANHERAIRDALARLGLHATSKQIVDALAEHGIDVSEAFVTRIKGRMVREQERAMRERSKRTPQAQSHTQPQQRKIPPRRG